MRGLKPRILALLLLLPIVITAFHWQTASAATNSKNRGRNVFLPVINSVPAATVDLRVTELSISQSVQDRHNGVPLVAGRMTVLRVSAQAVNPQSQTAALVSVSALRAGTPIGEIRSAPRVIPINPTIGDYNSTFNFVLPNEWLTGQVVLSVSVDPNNAVSETNEGNNGASHNMVFQNVAPLEITIVPIDYTHIPDAQLYPGVQHDPISDWLRSVYPVSDVKIAYHAPYRFVGNLSQGEEWGRLLDELTHLASVEVGDYSPRVYYGLIPTDDGNGRSWFSGGIAGLGWVGSRVSIGLDLDGVAGKLAGHEIGHNFGRYHAPCGNPGNVDPHFPYPNGSIGEYGLDLEAEIVFMPHEARDMMGYCGPEWVSDYTYEALLQEQVRVGGRRSATISSSGMLLRAKVDESGQATLQPVYSAVPVYESPERRNASGSPYVFELVAADGRVVESFAADLLEAGEEGVSVQMLRASVPASVVGATTIRLLHEGQVVAERALATGGAETQSAAPQLMVERDAAEIRLSWGGATQPALVRYSADGGQTWTVLAVDAVDGELAIDPAYLPDNGQGEFQVIVADSAEPLVLSTSEK